MTKISTRLFYSIQRPYFVVLKDADSKKKATALNLTPSVGSFNRLEKHHNSPAERTTSEEQEQERSYCYNRKTTRRKQNFSVLTAFNK